MMTTASRAIRLYGTEQVDPPHRILRAGALSIAFDNGGVRYVRFGGIEVLRGIMFLVRDENWGTFTPVLEDLTVEEGTDAFSISYRATCADAVRKLVYRATIIGKSDGSLSFVAEATPETDVVTNRTGFIVLHPIDGIAGKPVKVLREDGSEDLSAFPANIDPRCPFTDIRALSHEIAPGVWATCTMEGDAFEMEDQRNWSDASYKTYVRPLRRPWGYTLPKGETFTQSVRLTVSGELEAGVGGANDAPVTLTIGEFAGKLARIGIGVPAEEAAFALANPELIRKLAPNLMVCQIDLRRSEGHNEVRNAGRLATMTGAKIVLEIITRGTLDPAGELAPVAETVRAAGLALEAVTVFPDQDMKSVQPDAPWPPMPTYAENFAAAQAAFPGVAVGGGMAAYFTELNRKRPPAAALDYVTFTTCPSVHAADDVSVMETLEAVPHLIRSTRAFMGADVPVRIGPSQLGCRENAYGKATAPNESNGRVCLSRIDPRQRGLFNAAWTLAYIAACSREGVEAVTLGAPSGPFGYMARTTDFVQPWYDEQPGTHLYPAFHVMAGLSALDSGDVLSVRHAGQGRIDALAVRKDGSTTLWLANLTPDAVTVAIADARPGAQIAMLSADQFEHAARDADFLGKAATALAGGEVILDAYAVALISLG